MGFLSACPRQCSGIVRHCDRTLKIDEIADYDGAVNGLQVENNGQVSRIAAAVDASFATVRKAIEAKATCWSSITACFEPATTMDGQEARPHRRTREHNLASTVPTCHWICTRASATTPVCSRP